MALPRPPPDGGFSFTWTSSVAPLHKSMKELLSTRTLIAHMATGALVFSRATGTDRVLIIQRAAHDSMALLWEIPGGACDAEDQTLLHGLARELWEETGLRLKTVVRQVGPENTFFTRSGRVVSKVTFEVEVEGAGGGGGDDERLPEVTLDPNEHVRFLWATEDECRLGKVIVPGDGGEQEAVVDIEFTGKAQKAAILLGFRLRREASQEGSTQE
ncbi:hypothetical protein VTK26DRAFT_2176 [Humicola hyalothermophila]